MCGRTAGWRVLVLLAFSAAFSRAQVTPITLASMTWSGVDPDPPTITVCTEDDLSEIGGDAVQLGVKKLDGSETVYSGVIQNSTCANFLDMSSLLAPEPDITTYELTVYSGEAEVVQGSVTFAFPLTQGQTINCEPSQYGRFVVSDSSSLTASCLAGPINNACYVTTDISGTPCVPGLDVNYPNFTVCVPSSEVTATPDLITGVSLTYNEEGNGGTFTISSTVDTTLFPLELISNTDTVSVIACNSNECTFDVFSPSENKYGLCGVYIDDSNPTQVGTFKFQDLNLRSDTVGSTVDFHFANLGLGDSYIYNVYGAATSGDVEAQQDPSFTLNCENIAPTSFCNGFFNDEPPPVFIGVSGTALPENLVITQVTDENAIAGETGGSYGIP